MRPKPLKPVNTARAKRSNIIDHKHVSGSEMVISNNPTWAHAMRPYISKKASAKTAGQDISELKRDQLGNGVRGKYLKHFNQGSNLVV